MHYSDYIEVNKNFQTSINLEYDINNIDKINSYIPTVQSVNILGKLLRSFYYNSESQYRANVLIGPYGRGKSHLMLILTALTSLDLFYRKDQNQDEIAECLNQLCEKINSVNNEVGALVKAIVENRIRTLPIIINSNTSDINQAFLIAMKDALERAGLKNLLPETYFDVAADVISKWEESYPEAYQQLQQDLLLKKMSVEDLKIGLRQYNQNYYNIFCECYPTITAGTEFNPLTSMDVVKLYTSISDALTSQTDYTGINVLFDEFSKFLETNLDKSKMLNFKIIQDLAEAATRSGNRQIHFTCITHKDILEYSTSDSFKTVEGRFKKIYYVASSEQSYELISNAIIKKESYENFYREYESAFDGVVEKAFGINIFDEMSYESFRKILLKGCFPMAPISTFSLLNVSEQVGQNERTLFTFLAHKDRYSLAEFLDKELTDIQFMTVSHIYDYFEELFQKEVFNKRIHSIWKKTDSALLQIENDVEKTIIKAIAIINIISDERFKTIPTHLKASLLMDDETFDVSISALERKHIISQKDSSEYVLLTANGVDVQKSVENYVSTKIAKINVRESLEKIYDLGYVIPHEYNDKFSILRCFKNIYLDTDSFLKYDAENLLIDYPYDGLLIHVLSNSVDEDIKCKEKLQEFFGHTNIVICITEAKQDISNLLKKHIAIDNLLDSAESHADPHYLEELEVFAADIKKQLVKTINGMYAPYSPYSSYFNCEGEINIKRQAELNQAISKICSDCFYLTPIINNEMVNKRTLNAQNLRGRDFVVKWVLEHSDDAIIPCMEGYGPEVSIFKSMYHITGLDNSVIVADEGINAVLGLIEDFVVSCERKKSNFSELYDCLLAPPYGMRRGIIPLFIAYILRKYKETAVFYFKEHEVELNASVLRGINESPSDYELLIEPGTKEREIYIKELLSLFGKYSTNTISANKIYSLVKSMQNWIRSLPEYTQQYKYYLNDGKMVKISRNIEIIRRELLKFDLNSREFVFQTLLNKIGGEANLEECIDQVCELKNILDNHIGSFKSNLIKYVTDVFQPEYKGSLAVAVKKWYRLLPDSTKIHMFDDRSNTILSIAREFDSYDDIALIDWFVLKLTSISIEDWNDGVAEDFIQNISDSVTLI